MPTTGTQPTEQRTTNNEQRGFCSVSVKVIGLRIKLSGKLFDLLSGDLFGLRHVLTWDNNIVPIHRVCFFKHALNSLMLNVPRHASFAAHFKPLIECYCIQRLRSSDTINSIFEMLPSRLLRALVQYARLFG